MRPEPKKRLDTNASQTERSRLNSAFASLHLPNPPAAPKPASSGAPVQPPSSEAKQTWKLGRVVLRKEKAHRGGKTVIVVHDFASHLPESLIERLAKKLRAACGCGGTVKERAIEIQGDQAGKIRELLEKEGFQVAGVR